MRGLDPLHLLDIWLGAGVRLIQLRAKQVARGLLLDLAEKMARRADAAHATLIINDRADIARLAGASGVHVGQDDLAPRDVRKIVGDSLVVGLSTHTVPQIAAALKESVSYLAIGPVFQTGTKLSRDAIVGLDGVRAAARASASSGLPIVAIGGITLATAPEVLAAGAASVAVVSDLMATDLEGRVRAYLSLPGL